MVSGEERLLEGHRRTLLHMPETRWEFEKHPKGTMNNAYGTGGIGIVERKSKCFAKNTVEHLRRPMHAVK